MYFSKERKRKTGTMEILHNVAHKGKCIETGYSSNLLISTSFPAQVCVKDKETTTYFYEDKGENDICALNKSFLTPLSFCGC